MEYIKQQYMPIQRPDNDKHNIIFAGTIRCLLCDLYIPDWRKLNKYEHNTRIGNAYLSNLLNNS